jgi:Transposase DDE domain
MTWELNLIATYYAVCSYSNKLAAYTIRQSNNYKPLFTDEEVITIYVFCVMDGFHLSNKKEIHEYADRHLRSWFPLLPNYEAFVQRCNNLCAVMGHLADFVYADICTQKPEYQANIREYIVDSLPIMLAQRQRASNGKVATEIADKGYCATKKTWYHGIKLHASGLMAADARLPILHTVALSAASESDNTIFKEEMARSSSNSITYADSAYMDKAAAGELAVLYNLTVSPIQRRVRGQSELYYDQVCQNTAISRIRQPIEGLFNWLIERTGIQIASKCRSTKGVLFHIHGKIAASAIFLLLFNS